MEGGSSICSGILAFDETTVYLSELAQLISAESLCHPN